MFKGLIYLISDWNADSKFDTKSWIVYFIIGLLIGIINRKLYGCKGDNNGIMRFELKLTDADKFQGG